MREVGPFRAGFSSCFLFRRFHLRLLTASRFAGAKSIDAARPLSQRLWANGLGQENSPCGRVIVNPPNDMKAPLARASVQGGVPFPATGFPPSRERLGKGVFRESAAKDPRVLVFNQILQMLRGVHP